MKTSPLRAKFPMYPNSWNIEAMCNNTHRYWAWSQVSLKNSPLNVHFEPSLMSCRSLLYQSTSKFVTLRRSVRESQINNSFSIWRQSQCTEDYWRVKSICNIFYSDLSFSLSKCSTRSNGLPKSFLWGNRLFKAMSSLNVPGFLRHRADMQQTQNSERFTLRQGRKGSDENGTASFLAACLLFQTHFGRINNLALAPWRNIAPQVLAQSVSTGAAWFLCLSQPQTNDKLHTPLVHFLDKNPPQPFELGTKSPKTSEYEGRHSLFILVTGSVYSRVCSRLLV